MKRLILLACVLSLSSVAQAQNDVVITGVIDGPLTGGTPKAIEVYVVNDVADLATYALGAANNGGGTDGVEFQFPAGSAAAGTFIWIASEIPQFQAWFGEAPDYVSSVASNNGDDAIELFYDADAFAVDGTETVVDVFGEVTYEAGAGSSQPWYSGDGWAYRQNFTGPDGSTFVLDHWTFSGTDALDGETDNATAATPFPTASYDPGRTVSQAVYDGFGWRLLSAPVAGLTVTDLAGINLVQGIAAGTPESTYPAQYEGAGANLFTEYTGTGLASGYNAPDDTDDPVQPGRGFFWYWYDQDITPSSGGTSVSYELSSFALTASGPELTADVSETFPENADGFYMIGNPFAESLYLYTYSDPDPSDDAVSASVGTIGSSFYVYDPSVPGYDVLTSASASPDALAAWQGAFAQVTGTGGAAPVISYDYESVEPNVPATFYGRQAAETKLALRLDGTLASGARVGDRTALLRLLADAEAGWDRHDLSELMPPNGEVALLALVGERDGAPHRQGVLSLPTQLSGVRTVPVAFLATGAGALTISWDAAVLPQGWTATLRDLATSAESDLAVAGSYAFEAEATDWTDRFEILLSATAVAAEGAPEASASVGDVYPNPAVGAARLGVRLAAAERVTATVYDALGRQVAVAFDGDLTVGNQTVDLATATLAPGVYVVRVEGETFAASRRLVVTR